jgi:hypothetical protein
VAETSYVFGDILTGEKIAEIRLTSVSFKMSLSTGEFRATMNLDQTGKSNDELISATIPGRCFCVVERDGIVVGDYIMWTRTYQSQAKVVQLYGVPWKNYPERRIRDTDFHGTSDQRNLFLQLYGEMQSATNSIRVELPGSFPDTLVEKTLDVTGTDYKTYRQIMDSIADTDDGFDWTVRTNRVGGAYTRTLDIGFPTLGQAPGPTNVTFEYIDMGPDNNGGNVTNYWVNDTMAPAGTDFYGIGAGDGATMLVANVSHTDLYASGFPRWDTSASLKDINDPVILAALSSRLAQQAKAPQSVYTVEVKAGGDAGVEFGSYNFGDYCNLVIQDARHADGLNKSSRILGWEYYPQEDSNVEYARITLDSEDAE